MVRECLADAHPQSVPGARTPDVSSQDHIVCELWNSLATAGHALAASGDHPGRAGAGTHCGYRCPNSACAGGPTRTYRSAVADGLALPGFTLGLN